MKLSIAHIIDKIDYLPTIPETAQEVLKLTDNELASVVSLGKIIDKDVSISAKILHVANSARFGYSANVSTVNEAILRIGFLNVKNIAFGLSLMSVFHSEKGKKIMDYERIFEHSANVGVAAKLLMKELGPGLSEDVFIHGLLHDIGFLVLCNYCMDQYDSVMYNFHRHEEKSILEAEQNILGLTHADVGSWLAEHWELDKSLVDTIRHHHCPSRASSNKNYVAVVHISDCLVSEEILGVTRKSPRYQLDRAALDVLNLSESDMSGLKEILHNRILR